MMQRATSFPPVAFPLPRRVEPAFGPCLPPGRLLRRCSGEDRGYQDFLIVLVGRSPSHHSDGSMPHNGSRGWYIPHCYTDKVAAPPGSLPRPFRNHRDSRKQLPNYFAAHCPEEKPAPTVGRLGSPFRVRP